MGEYEAQALARALAETGRALESARSGFDETADGDLLAYYLYETHALEARYAYLLRRAAEARSGGGKEGRGMDRP